MSSIVENDKKKKRIILIAVIVLVVINLLVFSILFLDLSKYIWPEETKAPSIEANDGFVLSKDGEVTIDGITYKKKDDGNFKVISVENIVVTADIRNKINENDVEVVNEIEEKAFENCNNLEQVNICENITKIGDYAFKGCSKMSTITIPYGVNEIGNSIFYECTSLTSIKVAVSNENFASYDGILFDSEGKILYAYPFKRENLSYAFSDKLESIESNVFKDFNSIKSVSLPESLKTIGDSAFENCKNLSSVIINTNVTSIGNNAFAGCSEDLVIKGESGTYAETYAKENNIKFEAVTFEKAENINNNESKNKVENNNVESNVIEIL